MADDEVWHSANVPADFPTHDDIVNACDKAGFYDTGVCIQAPGTLRFWVKFGGDYNIRGEGRTQAYVAGIVNANPASIVRVPNVYLGFSRGDLGFIVMDFVDAVAAAFQQLTDIKMPANTAPSPVGGGYIRHNFFLDFMSKLKYPTVAHLEAQINEILRHLGNDRVDFKPETADGLVLCPSDPNESNFMIDREGIWKTVGHRLWPHVLPTVLLRVLHADEDTKHLCAMGGILRQVSEISHAASGRMVISGDNALGTVFSRSASIRGSVGQISWEV